MDQKKSTLILSTAYLGPVSYFANFLKYSTIIIEQYENYNKQSYRNRCIICSANGALPLSIPVKKTNGTKTLIRDIKIDYDTPWNKIHLRGIESGYKNAPFYEQYIDLLLPFYTKQHPFLLDFNLQLTGMILKEMGIDSHYSLSNTFIQPDKYTDDMRYTLHPKKSIDLIKIRYHQVFESRYGFMPDMSIIDLLFNEGPYCLSILRDCVETE